MTDAALSDFETTARDAERLAQSNLPLYKTKLLLFGVLGYFVIFAMLAGLAVALGGLGFLAMKSTAAFLLLVKNKIVFLIIPVIWVLLSSLWVRLEAPEGYTVTRNELPELFDAIEAVRRSLSAPKIHQVILTPELNAAVTQTPRLGIFGWNRNTLILGVELLLVLSPQQASAVIAHELGHLSGNHSRFNGWIYRVRQSWTNIMVAFDRRGGIGAGMMRRFFDWYAPRFAAYSFALARANEYEADAMSARLTDARVAGDALVNVHVSAPYVNEKYWLGFFRKADEMPEPDHLPWEGLSNWLASDDRVRDELAERLDAAMECETSYQNTHPSLGDRLKALGAEARLPEASEHSAAAAWFGERYDEMLADFDRDWFEANAPQWRQRYDYATTSKETLRELADRDPDGLSDDELWQAAQLTEEFGASEKAEPLYRRFQARYPDNPAAAFALGRLAYDSDDDELLTQMKIAVEQPEFAIDACQIAYSFLERAGRLDEAEWWMDKARQRAAIDRADEEERSRLAVEDDIVPIELPEEAIALLVEQLSASGRVKQAWVAQKQLTHYKHVPALAIAVTTTGISFTEESVRNEIEKHVDLNCTWFVVPKTGDYKELARKIARVGQKII